jgi:hypothetical protein
MVLVSNNPVIRKNYTNNIWVEGSPARVLEIVINMMGEGYHLIHSPLSPNNRLNKSPFRTVVLSNEKINLSCDEFEIVMKAYDILSTQIITSDPAQAESFQWLDNMLIENIINSVH